MDNSNKWVTFATEKSHTRMKRSALILLVFILGFTQFSQAQRHRKAASHQTNAERILKQYSDSLSQLRNYYDSTWIYPEYSKTLTDPYFYRLFVQPTFYFNPVKQSMDIDWKTDSLRNGMPRYSLGNYSDPTLKLNTSINDFFMYVYTQAPQYIVASQASVDQSKGFRVEVDKTIEKHEVNLANSVKQVKPLQVVEPVQVVSHRPNFWTFKQVYSLQFMQNYISSNWYKGGNSSYSFLGTANLTANYNNQNKVIFENSLDIKLGLQTQKGDTVHDVQTTTDQIRMVNKLGLRAIKNWYYTVSLQTWTQMMPKYSTNSHYVYSDFTSPLESVLSIGMEFKKTKGNLTLSANIAPLSWDMKYVARAKLETRYGNKANHHLREYYGSNITLNHSLKILKELTWTGRMYYFTNYDKVQWEWENTFNFTINKYLSTRIYLYPRFDDSQYDKKKRHRVQFKEWISLGFNYSL